MKKFVDSEKLNKLCKLARIYIKPEDTNKFLDLINGDLELLEALDKIDTSNLKELVNPYDIELKTYEDIVSDGNVVDELMKCAPKELYNYFVVPKVVK